ncbi:MAG: ABC transporter permease, partial [Proteobacteria bacterium]|nr:ABC transporter permease [Pseudomonadota bacterium]
MIWNAFLLAIREIRRNVLRSVLTALGVVIGVASVITLVTVGGGVTAKVKEDVSKLGSNLLMVRPGQFRGPGGGPSGAKPFTPRDLEAVRREIPFLSAVAPIDSKAATIIFSNSNRSTSVTGTENDYFKIRDWPLKEGRSFTEGELRSGKAVCIIGTTVYKELFGAGSPIGQRVRLDKTTYQVIGLLSSKGSTGMGNDQDDAVFVPLRTLQRRMTGRIEDINMIQISVQEGASTQTVQAQVESLLRQRRHIAASENDDFTVRDMAEIAETLQSTTKVLTTLLGAVAAVSLLVGGIGIMNIMLV